MKVIRALRFATKRHEGQFRRVSGEPYINHPISVSYLLAHYKTSKNMDDLLCAALFHDLVEDTETTLEEIREHFGDLVASLVEELTSDEEKIKQMGKNEYMKEKLVGMTRYGLTLKLVDRLSNIVDHPTKKYVQHTLDLMHHVKMNRELSKTQINIILDIEKECLIILNTKD